MASKIIVVEKELLKAKVFRQLNGTAKTVLFDFLMKRRMGKAYTPTKPGKQAKVRDILNNGELVYTYTDAKKNGIPGTSFMRAIDHLVKFGFIDIAQSGSGGRKGDTNLYAISDRWEKFGKDEFISTVRPKDTRTGRGFQPGNTQGRKRPKDIRRGKKSAPFPPEEKDDRPFYERG